jgi:hypothetical protein
MRPAPRLSTVRVRRIARGADTKSSVGATIDIGNTALSLGERVAIPQSRESRVRGYFVTFAHVIPLRFSTDPSPVPLRLVKTPAAGHPLPKGEGNDPLPL